MRIITDSDGRVLDVSFGALISCGGQDGADYTGTVPTGYTSLEDWYLQEADKLYRWTVVDGELTLDSSAVAPTDKLPAADYVVEQGTDGIWTYRKWNSGIAELWGTYTGTSVTPTAWGNIYASDAFPRIDYPFAFTSAPQVQVTPRYTGTGGGFWIYCVGAGYTTQTPFYGAGRANNTAIVPCIDFYVIGRWK